MKISQERRENKCRTIPLVGIGTFYKQHHRGDMIEECRLLTNALLGLKGIQVVREH